MERIVELDNLEKEYGTILDQLDIFEKIKDNLRQRIILNFEQTYGHQGATYVNPATGNSLQRVIQVRNDANADEVKRLLSPQKWEMVKKEVIDMPKLLSAIKLGVIDPIKLNGAFKTTEIDKVLWKEAK